MFLFQKEFKYEDLRVAMLLFIKGDYSSHLILNQDTIMSILHWPIICTWVLLGSINFMPSQCSFLGCAQFVICTPNWCGRVGKTLVILEV